MFADDITGDDDEVEEQRLFGSDDRVPAVQVSALCCLRYSSVMQPIHPIEWKSASC